MVTIPVVIQAGKTTSVHLDGSKLTPSSAISGLDLVSLPDGTVIGWVARGENGQQ
jgi:hypothetical protein